MINLARNKPVALVVGAAGFLGSHLADRLLEKGVQVVGVDDLSTGRKENLEEASKDKSFRIIYQQGSGYLPVEFPRLDYAFFMLPEDASSEEYKKAFDNFLQIAENLSPKIILVSSIDLYDERKACLSALHLAEKKLAQIAREKNTNARIVRLAAVYGPRMHFRGDDPIFRLIYAASADDLQKESAPLDFTTRALYISDAADLLIKAIMHGATAQKIYDGALLNPIKIAEIKQILLDPLWHENRKFEPTELPPWVTPNLAKTEKELSWHPKEKIVKALRETLHFFQKNPSFLTAEPADKIEPEKEKPAQKDKKMEKRYVVNLKKPAKIILILLSMALIGYALIFPAVSLAINLSSAGKKIQQSLIFAAAGDFDRGSKLSEEAGDAIQNIKGSAAFLAAINVMGLIPPQAQDILEFGSLLTESSSISSDISKGREAMDTALQVITGSREGDLSQYLESASADFASADQRLARVLGRLSDQSLTRSTPDFFRSWMGWGKGVDLTKLQLLGQNINQMKIMASFLPQITGQGEKTYLILLWDNNHLKNGGGQIKNFALITFKDGKLKDIEAGDGEKLGKQILGALDEPGFPASAKAIIKSYFEQNGIMPDGVIAADLANFTSAQFSEQLNKLFFLSGQNWFFSLWGPNAPLAEKHSMIYMSDPKLQAFISSAGWSGEVPVAKNEKVGEKHSFLQILQTDLSAEGSKYLERTINLAEILNEDGEDEGKLNIEYINRDPNLGYKGRVRVYFASGTTLKKAQWGSEDITKNIKSLSDFRLAGYEADISFSASEKKSLSLEYASLKKAVMAGGKLKYVLDVRKQPGTGPDQFNFKLNYPSVYRAEAQGATETIPRELVFLSDLAKDRSFEVIFAR